MAGDEVQQERRADTVALPRSTVKVAAFLAAAAFMAISSFVWDSGTKINDLTLSLEEATHEVRLVLENVTARVTYLEDFAKAGGRFTSKDGDKFEKRLEKLESYIEKHNIQPAHREQAQLNREILWRIEKLEVMNSDPSFLMKGNGK